MSIALTNAVLFDYDPPGVRKGCLVLDGGTIAAAGPDAVPTADQETMDCGGAIVMPGLVNGHTHLYSALAAGMPAPPKPPRNFHEILEFIWWRLDRALDADSIRISGLIGALDALHCGTTTLIDHHASPNCIDGSLDALERGIDEVGLRAVLCYETTERNGPGESESGLRENRRFIDLCRKRDDGRFAALVGAHAAFTLSDQALAACVQLANDTATGVHIHVAEDPCDDRICRERYGATLVDRLERSGITESGSPVASGSILAHCTHLAPDTADRVSKRVAAVAHNPRSNMNNRVGYAPIGELSRVQLGTDGIGSDMFAEAGHAWFKACDAKTAIEPGRVVQMLAQAAKTAGDRLGVTLGRLEAGAAADIVVTDYVPATPIDTENACAHLLFALAARHVRHVFVNGNIALRDREAVAIEESDVRKGAVTTARQLWQRMQSF
ncbi:MAG: amidohydrolase family protein [Planctomycetota bacterium]|nr:amidohydrolase family protein [Planctomycetota bacterium]